MAYEPGPPVACSLTADEQRGRGIEARELMNRALVSRDRTQDGLRLRFRGPSEARAAVRDLARREKECCPFFEFELTETGEELVMTVSAPPDALALLDSLFAEQGAAPPSLSQRRAP